MSDEGVYMDDFSVTFSQEPDCVQDDDEFQKIEFHTEDNGVGRFIWFKTDRWAISDAEDIFKLVKRVRAMEQTNNKYEKRDNIGSVENVYLSEEEYHKEREIINKHTSFVNKLHSSSNIYRQMSDEDIDTITKIMCKYDKEWATR